MKTPQEDIFTLILSLSSQLSIEIVRRNAIQTELQKEFGNTKNDLQIQHNICSAVIEEIQRQINKLKTEIQ